MPLERAALLNATQLSDRSGCVGSAVAAVVAAAETAAETAAGA